MKITQQRITQYRPQYVFSRKTLPSLRQKDKLLTNTFTIYQLCQFLFRIDLQDR